MKLIINEPTCACCGRPSNKCEEASGVPPMPPTFNTRPTVHYVGGLPMTWPEAVPSWWREQHGRTMWAMPHYSGPAEGSSPPGRSIRERVQVETYKMPPVWPEIDKKDVRTT